MGEVFAVLSGKGGTGKTSVCAGIAVALAQQGKKVLCIDCDVGLRNLDLSLGMSEGGALSFVEVSEGGYPVNQAAQHPNYPGLCFLTAPVNRRIEQIRLQSFREMLFAARQEFDYILLDAPAGVDAGFRLVTEAADRFLVVTGAGAAAIRDAARVSDLLELMGKQDVRLVVNRVDKDMLGTVKMTIDDVMDAAGLPLLGIVPEDHSVTLAAFFGEPLAQYSRRGKAVKAFNRIARRIQGFYEPIGLR